MRAHTAHRTLNTIHIQSANAAKPRPLRDVGKSGSAVTGKKTTANDIKFANAISRG